MDPVMDKSIQYLTAVEELAQDIMTRKEAKLELSNAHNKYREAIRALQQTDSRKTWMKCGSLFVEMSVDECKAILKNELDSTVLEIDQLHETIKSDLNKMRDLEHEPGIQGMSLKPLSASEAKAITKAFGI